MTTMTIDDQVLEEFLGHVISDAGAAVSTLLTHLGDRLGIYTALADGEAVSSAELAERTGTNPRLVREWLANQTAGGYVIHDADTDRFRLPPEHAMVLANEHSPVFAQGLFDMVVALFGSIDKEAEALRTGGGLAWADHVPELFAATARCFAPAYRANLVSTWIPALTGIQPRLEAGARVADVGCGHGVSTVLMATAFPRSRFVGYDYHEPSLEAARQAARRAGVEDRVRFEHADAAQVRGEFDLICLLDAWHDQADPVGVAAAARAALAPGGSVMLVEPYAGDSLAENSHPLGRFSYGVSTVVCTPCSTSHGGPGLGAQAGETRTRELFTAAGFTQFRRAAETPLNIVYEARVRNCRGPGPLGERRLDAQSGASTNEPRFIGTSHGCDHSSLHAVEHSQLALEGSGPVPVAEFLLLPSREANLPLALRSRLRSEGAERLSGSVGARGESVRTIRTGTTPLTWPYSPLAGRSARQSHGVRKQNRHRPRPRRCTPA